MASLRFHKAARDNILTVLKEATRRDCNAKDEDGMTPTMWAAFEGQLEALRLLIARGGNPDKGDNLGNTALHHAAERGHMNCVTFLVNFGANMWSLNCEMRTPKELAAITEKDDVLRFLDEETAKKETVDRKAAKAMKEKAQKELEKKQKEYEKVKKKAEKDLEKEQLRLSKERHKMEQPTSPLSAVLPQRLSTLRNKASGTVRSAAPSPRFSQIVGTVSASSGRKLTMGIVQKKAHAKAMLQRADSTDDDFKVGQVEEGRKSVRNLTGLRRDSEVLYVGRYENEGRRGKLEGVFADAESLIEEKDLEEEEEDDVLLQEPASIFDRPGFGNFAFRKSISSTLSALPIPVEEEVEGDGGSIGSAGSLKHHHHDFDDGDLSDEEDFNDDDWSPLQLFLVANGLAEYHNRFVAEKIDMEALQLLTDEDFVQLGLPLGPRRKLTQALENRRRVLQAPGQVQDSQL